MLSLLMLMKKGGQAYTRQAKSDKKTNNVRERAIWQAKAGTDRFPFQVWGLTDV